MKISIQIARGAGTDLLPTFASSLFFHLIIIMSLPFLPSFLPTVKPRPGLYVVDLVDLPPPGEPGGAAGGSEPAPQEEPPAPETETPSPQAEPPPPEPVRPEPEPEPTTRPPEKQPEEKEPEKRVPPVKEEEVRRPPRAEPRPETAPPASAGTPPPSSPGAGGGAGTGGDGRGTGGLGIEGGSGTAGFDDAAFRYAYYRVRMRNILRSQWSKPIYPPGPKQVYRSTVHFVIARDGTILDLELVESSGYRQLDLSALRAVRDTRRMPPLPLQYDRDRVGVTFIFELKPEDEAGSGYQLP